MYPRLQQKTNIQHTDPLQPQQKKTAMRAPGLTKLRFKGLIAFRHLSQK